jgi:TonB family protein
MKVLRLRPRVVIALAGSFGLHLLIALSLPRGLRAPTGQPAKVHELELRAGGPTLAISPSLAPRLAVAQLGDPRGRSPHGPAERLHGPAIGAAKDPTAARRPRGGDLDEARFAPYAPSRAPARNGPGLPARAATAPREPAPYLPARDGELQEPDGERLTRIPKDGEVALPKGLRVAATGVGTPRPGGGGDGAGHGGARRGAPDGVEHGSPLWLTGGDRRYVDYFRRIYRKVQPLWVFPKELEVVYEQGEVIVQFSILADGTIRGLRVRKSSGYRQFDANVVAAIEKAAPFGPIPRGLGRRLDILAPFEFANPMVR